MINGDDDEDDRERESKREGVNGELLLFTQDNVHLSFLLPGMEEDMVVYEFSFRLPQHSCFFNVVSGSDILQ